ncbi:MAG: hypothetical protein M5R37_02350 [Melioribacteraceae bacterium]|jgi:hypothetical protein|nr:hypothetical protein [Melioribacteraceae bacterium]
MNAQVKTQNRVDQLIHHFWKNGFLTLSRRYGKFLPEPKPIGQYQVDAVGKYKKKMVLGVILREEELNDPKIISKLDYLASQHVRSSTRRVTLFLGVSEIHLNKARMIVKSLPESSQKNIKLIPLNDE